MSRILVAYATRHGSTREVAEAVAEALGEAGSEVHVAPAGTVASLGPYDAVVLGSPLCGMRPLPKAAEFVARHRAALARLPLAEFTLSMTMAQDTPESRQRALRCLEPAHRRAPGIEPLDVGLFGGVIEKRGLDPFHRLLMILKRQPDHDHRDWEAIRRGPTGSRRGCWERRRSSGRDLRRPPARPPRADPHSPRKEHA